MNEPHRELLLDAAFSAYEKGQLDEAEVQVRRVLAEEPRSPLALHLLAIVAARTDRRSLAIALLREVIALEPDSSESLLDLGDLLRTAGNLAEAVRLLEKACQADPQSWAAPNALGEAYLAADRPGDAEACFKEAMVLAPQLGIPVYNLGVALQARGRDLEAAAEYRKAIAFDPHLAEPYLRLGALLHSHARREEALEMFRRASEVQPQAAAGRVGLAVALFQEGRMAAAEEALREVLAIDSENVEALCRLGDVLTRVGRFDEAVAAFSQAIAKEPGRASAYAGVVHAKRMTGADRPILDALLLQLNRLQMPPKDRATLHFAAGKIFDDWADYAAAIRHYDEGNRIEAERLKREGRRFDHDALAASVSRSIKTFTPAAFARGAELGSTSDLPVLIVGIPRSGTTLVEQILSSHPQIGAGDERPFWGEASAAMGDRGDAAVTAAEAARLTSEYLALLRRVDEKALRVTDKMPQNFLHLGLVHLLFPKARIIHCRRNAIDTCLSIYFAQFGMMPDFAFDRAGIVSFYEQYLRLMAHWRKVLPEACFLEIDYEELVADPEPVTRRMIAFCGLEWDQACLRSDRNRRAITTASAWQARQPIYTRSVERWRRYEAWLGEFRRLLPPSSGRV